MSRPDKKKKGSLREIEQGELMHVSKEKFSYKIVHGWDLKSSLECDTLWKQGWLTLLKQIQQAEPDETKQNEILASISTEDIHWDWFGKPNSAAAVTRRELAIISQARDLGDVDMMAGDYATVSPFYSDANFDPRLFPKVTAPRLIYSFNHSHYVARGISLESGGPAQYVGITKALCAHGFFRGRGYSAGEDYFDDKRRRIGNNATNGTVVTPSIVAHITYMVLGAKL